MMFETFVITFREGLEAFLIVAIMAAYLIRTGRNHLMPALYMGVIVAIMTSAVTGWKMAEFAEDPLWEGTLAMISGVMVASFTYYVMVTAKTIRQRIQDVIQAKTVSTGIASHIGIFIFVALMISREGMETALMLASLSTQAQSTPMITGGFVGLLSVAVIGWVWVRHNSLINLKLFLQVTGVFLILFSFDLFVYGIHELSEINALPFVGDDVNNFLHINTEAFGHDGIFAQIVTYGLILTPIAIIVFGLINEKKSRLKLG